MARTSGVVYPYTCFKKKIGFLERSFFLSVALAK